MMECDVDALQLLTETAPEYETLPCTISCAIYETCSWTDFTKQGN
ncbi:MAG TPA: ALQxL family class IV lanthipeptide [Micromonosporaceae bacterium]